MADWRFLAYDLRGSEYLCELDVQSWRSIDTLNKRGDRFDCVISPDLEGQTVVREATRSARCLIVAERDGVPVYSGIVWARRYDSDTRTIMIQGGDITTYFDHRANAFNRTYTQQDQFDIFRGLYELGVFTGSIADIDIVVDSQDSGVLRDRTYENWEGRYVGDLMRELSEVTNGFNFDFRVEYQAGAPVRQMRLWYPRRGRTTDQTGLRFRFGGNSNVTTYRMDDDGRDAAVRVWALGAGDGTDRLRVLADNTALANAGWPFISASRSFPTVTETSTLVAHAKATVDRLSVLDREQFELDVDPDFPGQPFGSWDIGDDCTVIIDDDALYPAASDGTPGLVRERRVTGHAWRVQAGAEVLTVETAAKVVPEP